MNSHIYLYKFNYFLGNKYKQNFRPIDISYDTVHILGKYIGSSSFHILYLKCKEHRANQGSTGIGRINYSLKMF